MQIFITGGTFDKEYNYINGKLMFSQTHVSAMLQRGRSAIDTEVVTLMMKDSLEMTDDDRRYIVEAIKASKYADIVLTHGTDTMVETAAFVAKMIPKDKTVVLTGAMIPYTFGTSSDGFFNLGSAMAFAQILAPGVYIAMNGRYYDWHNVRKNYNTGYFEYNV